MSTNRFQPRVCLLVFARTPRIGMVKTRMESVLSQHQCFLLHEALLRHTLSKVAGWALEGMERFVFFTFPLGQPPQLEIPKNISVDTQLGLDLGERMTHALQEKWGKGFRKILFIGTDSPLLEQTDVETAVRALDDHKVVIGPATDGGYYLIGFSAPESGVFSGIEWGTARVYQQTVNQMRRHSLRWHALRENFDLDTYGDLLKFLRLRSPSQPMNPASSLDSLFILIEGFVRQYPKENCL